MKAMITNMAITATPKNMGTWVDLVKGEIFNEEYKYDVEKSGEVNGGKITILDVVAPDGRRIIVDQDFNIKVVGKALSTTTGRALIREDLEGVLKYPYKFVKAFIVINESFKKGLITKEQLDLIVEDLSTITVKDGGLNREVQGES